MNGCVAAGRPAAAKSQFRGVRRVADINLARRPLHLRVAFQAKIRVAGNQQLSVHRAMRVVTNGAALA